MKKAVAVLCLLGLLTMCGCSGLLGGMQNRNIGIYMPVLTDGENTFLEYSVFAYDGYFCVKDDTFALAERPYPDPSLLERENDTKIVMQLFRTGLYDGGMPLEEEFAFLSASFDDLLAREDYLECVLLCSGGEFYGILNCYKRPAGRSGSMLAFEDLKYSCLLDVENGQLVLREPMEGVALLACNRTHYVTYQDKMICSVNRENGEKTEILEDQWWNRKTNNCYVNFYYSDDVFYMTGRQVIDGTDHYTLYACRMDGTCVQQLMEQIQE